MRRDVLVNFKYIRIPNAAWAVASIALLAAGCDSPEAPQTTPVTTLNRAETTDHDICGLQRVAYSFRGLRDEFLVGATSAGPVARKALFAKRRIVVNTDGAPKSYHSSVINADNPKVGALNIICNAGVKIHQHSWKSFFRRGPELACYSKGIEVSPAYMQAFDAIRRNNWRPASGYEITFNYDILAKKSPNSSGPLGWLSGLFAAPEPCVGADGFFVSMTAARHHVTSQQCDQTAYLDATQIKGFVLPQHWFADWNSSAVARWASFRHGDVVVAYRPAETGRQETWIYGIVGDAGPIGKLGEATIRFNWELLRGPTEKINESIRTYKDVNGLDTGSNKIAFVVLEGSAAALAGNFSSENIDTVSRREFTKWGGIKRFKSCADRF